MKLTDKILSKIADVLLSKMTEDNLEVSITVKAKKGESNETS